LDKFSLAIIYLAPAVMALKSPTQSGARAQGPCCANSFVNGVKIKGDLLAWQGFLAPTGPLGAFHIFGFPS
jgi:hypothetical protein